MIIRLKHIENLKPALTLKTMKKNKMQINYLI